MRALQDAHWEWSVFWRSDQLQSCGCVAGDGEADSIAAAWRVFFDALPAASRVLDLATGNGVLAGIAASVSQSRGARIDVHGVDAADIDPAHFVPSAAALLSDVRFHPRTRLEALPFPDGAFDAVVSQYGVEYSDTSRSLAEAIRVLGPGGRLRFLVHASGGVPAERCALQRRQAATILGSGLFPALGGLLRDIVAAQRGNSPSATAAAQESIGKVGALVASLDAGFSAAADRSLVERVLDAVRELPGLRKTRDLDTLLNAADSIRYLLEAQLRRLEAMQQAALSEREAREMAAALSTLTGAETCLETATSGRPGHIVGFWIAGEKPAQGTVAR